MINEIKTTAHNMLHCNENAKRVKAAEEATKRVAVIGGAATLTSMIAGFLAKRAWKKEYMSLETAFRAECFCQRKGVIAHFTFHFCHIYRI